MAPSQRRTLRTYSANLVGRWKHAPTSYHWPSLWAMLLGFAVQFAVGIFPTFFCFVLLVAADDRRCPVAVGASSMRPFYAWLVGVCIGVSACEYMRNDRRAASLDWVFWGATAEAWQMLADLELDRYMRSNDRRGQATRETT